MSRRRGSIPGSPSVPSSVQTRLIPPIVRSAASFHSPSTLPPGDWTSIRSAAGQEPTVEPFYHLPSDLESMISVGAAGFESTTPKTAGQDLQFHLPPGHVDGPGIASPVGLTARRATKGQRSRPPYQAPVHSSRTNLNPESVTFVPTSPTIVVPPRLNPAASPFQVPASLPTFSTVSPSGLNPAASTFEIPASRPPTLPGFSLPTLTVISPTSPYFWTGETAGLFHSSVSIAPDDCTVHARECPFPATGYGGLHIPPTP
jgi:hypothetical protein